MHGMENVKLHSSVSTCGPINEHVKLPETYSDADHAVNSFADIATDYGEGDLTVNMMNCSSRPRQ
jgi:hypothetical protein